MYNLVFLSLSLSAVYEIGGEEAHFGRSTLSAPQIAQKESVRSFVRSLHGHGGEGASKISGG